MIIRISRRRSARKAPRPSVVGVLLILGALAPSSSARASTSEATRPAAERPSHRVAMRDGWSHGPRAKRTDAPVVEFDHSKCLAASDPAGSDCAVVRSIDLEDGEPFRILIRQTNPEAFDYNVSGIERIEPEDPSLEAVAAEVLVDQWFAHVHDDQFGGYLVSITKKEGEESALGPATLTIRVETKEWMVDFGGAFAFSGLTDPVFYTARDVVGQNAAGEDSLALVLHEDEEAKDASGTDVVTFAHVYHSSWPIWVPGLAFGISVDPNDPGAYYVGGAWRFGRQASLVLGGAYGPVARSPSGVSVPGVVGDANVLNDLPNRREWSVFVGVSFAFLGEGRAALSKPFQGQAATVSLTPDDQAPPPPGPGPDMPPQEEVVQPESPSLEGATVIVGVSAIEDRPLAARLTVTVRSADGDPLEGVALRWPQGGIDFPNGAVEGDPSTNTDENGVGSATLALTALSGDVQFGIRVGTDDGFSCEVTVPEANGGIDADASTGQCAPLAP